MGPATSTREGLVASYQEVIALRGITIFGVVYLLVRAHAQHLEQNASSVRNVVHPGSGRSARSE